MKIKLDTKKIKFVMAQKDVNDADIKKEAGSTKARGYYEQFSKKYEEEYNNARKVRLLKLSYVFFLFQTTYL